MIEKVVRFNRVTSTQDKAKEFVADRHPIAVVASSQEKGRGRQGRNWFSPEGGLYLSLLLFPKERVTSIPLLASLSVIRTLEHLGLSDLSIHWPNDVLLKKRKVCGVVCERYQSAVICGVGLNVNVETFAPRLDGATSLKVETGQVFGVDEILDLFLDKFNELYEELQSKGLKIKEVLNYISGLGESVEVVTKRGVIRGTVSDIDDDWALLLRDESGIIKKFYYGDVRRLQW
ncbi:MAG: biotin--[acetyl-CoA-carboxylase] ligase [candidate division WOR-3 bacterium]|nr:MAG: biotin--[acetyl-CoA-carboxylase] ligase [candidate division WOR-3 bacterium]